jgi:hypothetical protein
MVGLDSYDRASRFQDQNFNTDGQVSWQTCSLSQEIYVGIPMTTNEAGRTITDEVDTFTEPGTQVAPSITTLLVCGCRIALDCTPNGCCLEVG